MSSSLSFWASGFSRIVSSSCLISSIIYWKLEGGVSTFGSIEDLNSADCLLYNSLGFPTVFCSFNFLDSTFLFLVFNSSNSFLSLIFCVRLLSALIICSQYWQMVFTTVSPISFQEESPNGTFLRLSLSQQNPLEASMVQEKGMLSFLKRMALAVVSLHCATLNTQLQQRNILLLLPSILGKILHSQYWFSRMGYSGPQMNTFFLMECPWRSRKNTRSLPNSFLLFTTKSFRAAISGRMYLSGSTNSLLKSLPLRPVLWFPDTTPSTFSMGTTLKRVFLRRKMASGELPHRNCRKPCIMQDPLDSPGCVLAEATTHFRGLSKRLSTESPMVRRGTAKEPKEVANLVYLTKGLSLSSSMRASISEQVQGMQQQICTSSLLYSKVYSKDSLQYLGGKASGDRNLRGFFSYLMLFPLCSHSIFLSSFCLLENTKGFIPLVQRLWFFWKLQMWKVLVASFFAPKTLKLYHWKCPLVLVSGLMNKSYSPSATLMAQSKFPDSYIESNLNPSASLFPTKPLSLSSITSGALMCPQGNKYGLFMCRQQEFSSRGPRQHTLL